MPGLTRLTAAIFKRRGREGEAPLGAPAAHLALGARGERIAADVLERAGYRLVAANFKLPVGRNLRGAVVRAEIDLVAYDGATLCFVEVKTRASDWFARPEANVDLRKQRQISRAARAYRHTFGVAAEPYRYDVVSVILPHAPGGGGAAGQASEPAADSPGGADGRTADSPDGGDATRPRVELLRDFWTDAKFRKRRWSGAAGEF